MSFRIKLLLAMMLLVVGVMGATLYVTQKRVRATYLKLAQDQFESEVSYFTTQQELRLDPYKERCEELAKLPAFRDALKAGAPAAIYQTAIEFLDPTNQTPARAGRFGPRAAAHPDVATASLFRANTQPFFRVLDASGNILHQSEQRGGNFRGGRPRRWESQLAAVHQSLGNMDEQAVGYLAPERTNGIVQLLEVIVTKVLDPDHQQTMGALVLGIPFQETSEKAMSDLSKGGIRSGIWLDNSFHSGTIPDNVREEFSRKIAGEVDTNGVPQHEMLDLTLGNVPRRVFFKLLNPNSPFPPAYQVSLYSMAAAMRAEEELRVQTLAFAGLAMVAGLALSLFIAHGLSIPLRELVKGTQSVRAGDFQVHVPVRGKDEVGQLASSFNEMAEGLAQKEHYRTLLNLVADEKVAHALVNGQLALGGEVRDISVLFCDIRGFTELTANMPPQEVIALLNEHMTALTRVVKEHHGVIDKFVGDMLMAIFGAPASHGDDALNAARCAMRLVAERANLNTVSRHKIQIGVGLATGHVVAGCMGSADRQNYTVVGERVNLAARLCAAAGSGQIIIDQTTVEKLGDVARTTALTGLNLKGFSENTAAYQLDELHSWELAT
jgi:class 3 adenylate cyclase